MLRKNKLFRRVIDNCNSINSYKANNYLYWQKGNGDYND